MRSALPMRTVQGTVPHVWVDFFVYTYKFTFDWCIITTQMSFLYAPTTSACRTSPTTSDHFRRLPTSELLRRLPTISVDFRLPNFSDDFRPFPMTSDFRTIVPQRNQSEGSQTIHLICMTVGTKLTPNAAFLDIPSYCSAKIP